MEKGVPEMAKYNGPIYQKRRELKQSEQLYSPNRKKRHSAAEQKQTQIPFFQQHDQHPYKKTIVPQRTSEHSNRKQINLFHEERSSTPFKVHEVPPSYFGKHHRKVLKKKDDIDFSKLKESLTKREDDFLLLDCYLSSLGESLYIVTNEEIDENIVEIEEETEEEAQQEIKEAALVEVDEETQEAIDNETDADLQQEVTEGAEAEKHRLLVQEGSLPVVAATDEQHKQENGVARSEEHILPEEDLKETTSFKTVFSGKSDPEPLVKPKRKSLSRSLAGMIAEEFSLRESRGGKIGRYFDEFPAGLPSVATPTSSSEINDILSEIQSTEQKETRSLQSRSSIEWIKERRQKAVGEASKTAEDDENTNNEGSVQEQTVKDETIDGIKKHHKVMEEQESIQEILSSLEESDRIEELDRTKEQADEETLLTSTESEKRYTFPSVSLLKEPVAFETSAIDDWVLEQAERLNETLDAFNVDAQVVSWTIGPAVTQFELQLARGVKVNKITNLSDDLKLSLAAKDIRIEAPIPGKNTVGVEIPNEYSRPVMLAEVMKSEAFVQSPSPLTIAIGINLSGESIVTTLNKMPHGLIAGATGSGKSVFINSLLVSLLYKAKPSEVKLILIDPKAVELAPYNGIPHLLSPVISEPKAANEALKWAVNEMEERYQKLAAAGARNIEQFNQKAEKAGDYGLKIPYIVIVIDELADLMMVASNEVQDSIARITQKARAAGIHLIVATQRPSVDVITGTIKNNIPSRIAFMVSSQVDSRTILDASGAEKLLGKGDMLFLGNGTNRPVRLQGTFVDEEIDSVVDFVKEQRKPVYAFQPESLMKKAETIEERDELFEEVLPYIVEAGHVSASSLQRKFKIGFNRASNLIEALEQENIISENKGSKPREVYLTQQEYEDKFI